MAKTKKSEVESEVEGLENVGNEAKVGVYEVGYIMLPSIAEENLGGEVTAFKDMLTLHGATFVSDEHPKMMELAYEMSRSIANKKQKFSYGYFGWVKFECTGIQAKIIKDILDKDEKLVRYLLTKTVRENTMSPKRPYGKAEGSMRRKFTPKEEVSTPINEETIDKEIDALVV
jgi:ribosomal protein S6